MADVIDMRRTLAPPFSMYLYVPTSFDTVPLAMAYTQPPCDPLFVILSSGPYSEVCSFETFYDLPYLPEFFSHDKSPFHETLHRSPFCVRKLHKKKRARRYAGVVFTHFSCAFLRFCHVLKEFPRLRSRYVLVLLFPKQTNFYFFKTTSGSDSTLPCP